MTILRRGGRRPHGLRGRGQALVEFALVIPVFLLILMMLLDFGRVIYAQHTINQDAAEGARVGAVSADTLATSTDFTNRFTAIRNAAKVMSPAAPMNDASIFGATGNCNAATGTPAMPPDPIVSSACFYPYGVNNASPLTPPKIVVKVQVTVSLITPIISNIVGGSIILNATSEQLLQ
jgi:Flp pilus assembly protein TadG